MAAMRVSTRGDYASRALLSLALHADDARPTSVRDIADRTGLPQPYLEQILLALKGAGLVRSKRGVGGGYVLAAEPGDITLGDIVSAVDGPIGARRLRRAPHRTAPATTRASACCWPSGARSGDQTKDMLDSYTLADVAAMARGAEEWPPPEA